MQLTLARLDRRNDPAESVKAQRPDDGLGRKNGSSQLKVAACELLKRKGGSPKPESTPDARCIADDPHTHMNTQTHRPLDCSLYYQTIIGRITFDLEKWALIIEPLDEQFGGGSVFLALQRSPQDPICSFTKDIPS